MQTRLKNALFIYATSHQRYGLRSKHCHLSKQMRVINVENILPLFGQYRPFRGFLLLQFENHFGGLISLYSYFYLFKIDCYDILLNLSAVLVNIVTGTNIPKIFSAHLAYI